MAIPGTYSQVLYIPADTSSELHRYIYALVESYGGFPGYSHWTRGKGEELMVVFLSPAALGQFLESYGKALNGEFIVPIWEKVNGPIISEDKRLCLLGFHNVLKEVKPVIKFIEENGGWPTPTETNGFKPLEDALHYKTLPIEMKVSSDKFLHILTSYFLVRDTLAKYPNLENLPKGNIDLSFRRNILQMYGEFGMLYAKMLPLIHFIEENGGWSDSDDGDFPGFAALRSSCSSGNLPQEVMTSLDDVELFMKLYSIGNEFVKSQKVTTKIIPHDEV